MTETKYAIKPLVVDEDGTVGEKFGYWLAGGKTIVLTPDVAPPEGYENYVTAWDPIKERAILVAVHALKAEEEDAE